VVEEIVYRGVFGVALRRRLGGPWGAWLSAVLFAFMHTQPTLARLGAGAVGLPLGPFLLGLLTELTMAASGSLWPGVLLHAACNATPWIFAWGDPRWFTWLAALYL
jgi:membrane protease YdiL (CAAX protease family)